MHGVHDTRLKLPHYGKVAIVIVLLFVPNLIFRAQTNSVPIASSGFIFPFPSPTLVGYGYLAEWPCNVGKTLHPGEDIKDNDGDWNIRAIADGQVAFVDWSHPNSGFGYHLAIEHSLPDGNHIYSHYAHLSDIYVSATQTVTKGNIIGRMGQTGNATGPHLHFEIRAQQLGAEEWPPCSTNLEQGKEYITNWIAGGGIPRYVFPTDFINYSEITDQVILFEHSYYRGFTFRVFDADFYNLSVLLNDKASSIALPSEWSAMVYKHANGDGGNFEKRRLFANDVDFSNDQFFDGTPLNDNISAIEVFVPAPSFCPLGCEVNGDGNVGGEEYLYVVGDNWDCGIEGNCPSPLLCEVNGDGNVGGEEYLFVVGDYWDCGLPQSVSDYLIYQHETKYAAGGASGAYMGSFQIEPVSQQILPGNPVTITVVMDPGVYDISFLRLQLNFPEDKLSVNPNDVSTGLNFGSWEVISNTVGIGAVRLALGCGNPCTVYPSANGPVTVATLRFASNSSVNGATAKLAFEPNPLLTEILDNASVPQNILGSAAPGEITFTSRIYLPLVLKSS